MFFKKKYGITIDEYNEVVAVITAMYNDAHSKQAEKSVKPSQYMRGLYDALDVLLHKEPHVI